MPAWRFVVFGLAQRGSSKMNSAFLDWSDVRVFLAVCRNGSTLAASRKLGLSQPTVTRRISALEHALGLKLFDRDTHGFRPTDAARRLLPHAERLEDSASAFGAAAAQARRANAQAIRITAPRRNFSPIFTAIIAEFIAEHPGTRFEFIASYEVLDLVAGAADIAIRIAPQIDDARLICARLTHVASTLFASRGYALRHGLPASAAEFAGHSFVVFDRAPGSMPLNTWLLERIAPEQIVARCEDTEAVTASVEAGLGIGPVPVTLALDYPSLVRCFDPPDGTDVTSWLVISPDAYQRPEVRAFAKFFAPRFRAAYKLEHTRAMQAQAFRAGVD